MKKIAEFIYLKFFETNSKEDCLVAMNELLYTTVKNRDLELEKSIEDFYYYEFSKKRKEAKENEPVVYSNLLYEANYNLVSRIIENKGSSSKTIENRAINTSWLLGDSFFNHKISNDTYLWLWKVIYLIADNDSYVKNYWETVSAFFNDPFHKYYDYAEDESIATSLRENERIRFIEIQYIFVGLLLSKKKYKSLNYILTHTKSMPADYPLLPKNCYEIFKIFNYFNQDFSSFGKWYYYPDVDWVNSDDNIKKWVNSYISILFLREYVFKNNDQFPVLNPKEFSIYQKRRMVEDLPFLIDSLTKVLNNSELQKNLDFLYDDENEKFPERKVKAVNYLKKFSNHIEKSIDYDIISSKLIKDSVDKFYVSVKRFFEDTYNIINEFKNTIEFAKEVKTKKYYISSYKKNTSKSPFIEGDISHINFHDAYADAWSKSVLSKFIDTFISSRTRSYLVNNEDFEKAIIKLKVDDDFILIGLNLSWDVEQEIYNIKREFKKLNIPYSNISNVLYILRKSDLPIINYKNINPIEKSDYKLEYINEDFKIYASVLDLNKESDLRKKIIQENDFNTDSELVKLVSMVVALNTEIIWKKEAEVVQLSLQSQYSNNRGVLNDINDIIPFKKDTTQNIS
jgi:hypothetical protein